MTSSPGAVAIVALAWSLMGPGSTPAGTDRDDNADRSSAPLRLTGSLRLRAELKDGFDFSGGGAQEFLLVRSRVALRWEAADGIAVFAEGQDARVLGESATAVPAIDRDAVPNLCADRFDLHQGYADLRWPAPGPPLTARLGRQALDLGAQRLFASLDWENTARVWDGVRLTLGRPEHGKLDLIAARPVAVDPDRLNGHATTSRRHHNSRFFAAYYTDPGLRLGAAAAVRLEGYVLWRSEARLDDQVITLGARWETATGPWEADGEAAAQAGQYGGVDHGGLAFHLGAGYRARYLHHTRFGLAYNYGTGDGDPGDGKHRTFDHPQYPLDHAHHGHMDLFALQNLHNVAATAQTAWRGLQLRLAYQGFWIDEPEADAWYDAGGSVVRPSYLADPRTFAGGEVDGTLRWEYGNGRASLEMGCSRFFPGGYTKDTGPAGAASSAYVMHTAWY